MLMEVFMAKFMICSKANTIYSTSGQDMNLDVSE